MHSEIQHPVRRYARYDQSEHLMSRRLCKNVEVLAPWSTQNQQTWKPDDSNRRKGQIDRMIINIKVF